MHLEGSCHCKAVSFTVDSRHPYPFNLCYCKICRKTAGGGGYAINISASMDMLKIEGHENISSYQALVEDDDGGKKQSSLERKFCSKCGSALWAWDARWPELLHPHASAIDTPLPEPPERTHLMLSCKAPWVSPAIAPHDKSFDAYPDESIAAWHQRLGIEG